MVGGKPVVRERRVQGEGLALLLQREATRKCSGKGDNSWIFEVAFPPNKGNPLREPRSVRFEKAKR